MAETSVTGQIANCTVKTDFLVIVNRNTPNNFVRVGAFDTGLAEVGCKPGSVDFIAMRSSKISQ
jgi:hypothetical protein